LDLGGIDVDDGDLLVGPSVSLQEVIDSETADLNTAGLLPTACRAQSPSRTVRSMATLAGEAAHGATDSSVGAALLALNAIFEIAHPEEPRESPALRFVPRPEEDLRGGGLVRRIRIPGAPDGAALERASVLPTAPPLAIVAVTVATAGEKCSRARIAVGGLRGRPVRILEAEIQIERTSADDDTLRRAAEEASRVADVPDDGPPVPYRRRLVRVLTFRALKRALAQARSKTERPKPRVRPRLTVRAPRPLPYFTSGRVELTVNGKALRADAEARTTLVDLLRRSGLRGVREACGTGGCGSCTVLLDGQPACACLTLAVRAHGRSVVTVEGLGGPRGASPIPAAFESEGALHCGYCTPGLEISAKALLDASREPSRAEAVDALAGCLCPCTGGLRPVEAALAAAARKARA
jgi:aerobic-type carbon monoxide dehydrogenase small subunit (CoxS/CutS family)/CO/xanthine dehydrogenase FAD-binding subunit